MTDQERMAKRKTQKIAEIQTGRGFDLIVIKDLTGSKYPLKVYKHWYEYHGDRCYGWHKKKLHEFGDMVTAMRYMTGVISGQIPV